MYIFLRRQCYDSFPDHQFYTQKTQNLENQIFSSLLKLHKVTLYLKSTQYKKLAPNALWFTWKNKTKNIRLKFSVFYQQIYHFDVFCFVFPCRLQDFKSIHYIKIAHTNTYMRNCIQVYMYKILFFWISLVTNCLWGLFVCGGYLSVGAVCYGIPGCGVFKGGIQN